MKKIISALLVTILALTSILAVIPVSADEAKATFNVNWIKLSYNTYTPNDTGAKDDFGATSTKSDASVYEGNFDVTKKSDSLESNGKSNSVESYYISSTQFPLAEGAQFEYVFKAKRNAQGHAGVPFAIDGDTPYLIYSDFSSNMRYCKGPRSNKKQDFTPSWTADGDGFISMKVVFDGFTATVYAKKDGSYKQQGNSISLADGSRIVLGVYSRETSDGKMRTGIIKNAVLYGMNDAAAKIINTYSSGLSSALLDYVRTIESTHKEADYTADSYKALKTALDAATAAAGKADLDQAGVDAAKANIDKAVAALVANDSIDDTRLKKLFAEYDEIKRYEVEYTVISLAMVTKAVDEAKELLEKPGVKQSELDAAADVIQGRIQELLPSGLKVPRPVEAATGSLESESGSETTAVDDGGCRSAVATTAVALSVVAMLGTALVVKKKD